MDGLRLKRFRISDSVSVKIEENRIIFQPKNGEEFFTEMIQDPERWIIDYFPWARELKITEGVTIEKVDS